MRQAPTATRASANANPCFQPYAACGCIAAEGGPDACARAPRDVELGRVATGSGDADPLEHGQAGHQTAHHGHPVARRRAAGSVVGVGVGVGIGIGIAGAERNVRVAYVVVVLVGLAAADAEVETCAADPVDPVALHGAGLVVGQVDARGAAVAARIGGAGVGHAVVEDAGV